MKKLAFCVLLSILFIPLFLVGCGDANLYVLFNEESATYYVGDTVLFSDLGYTSNAEICDLNFDVVDENIAGIDGKGISFLSSGKTKLILSVKDSDVSTSIDLTVKPKAYVPVLRPEKEADSHEEIEIDIDYGGAEELAQDASINGETKLNKDDQTSPLDNEESESTTSGELSLNTSSSDSLPDDEDGPTIVYSCDTYNVEVISEDCLHEIKSISTSTCEEYVSFTLEITDDNSRYDNYSWQTSLPEGYSSEILFVEKTNYTFTILCLAKCDFCVTITALNSEYLGSMTITFRYK